MISSAKSALCLAVILCGLASGAAQKGHATKPQGRGYTALMRAAEGGRVGSVRALLRRGADVNASDGSGRTALILAAAKGHVEVVKTLLAAGANANLQAFGFHAGDFTALTTAMDAPPAVRVKLVEVLLNAGAQINPMNAGRTPLMRAVEKKDLSMMEVLLRRGADVNGRNFRGLTPLMAAVVESSPAAAKLLLAAGADVNARSEDGRTALSLAEEIHNEFRLPAQADLVRILKAAGAAQ